MYKSGKRLVSVLTMIKACLASWLFSKRTVIMLAMIGLFCYSVCNNFGNGLALSGNSLHWAEMIFYVLNQGCNVSMISILFLLTILEIPQRLSFQNFMLIRTTRLRWIAAQLGYCALIAMLMVLLVGFLAAIFTFPFATPGGGWTESALVAQNILEESETLVPQYIRSQTSEAAAIILAAIPLFLFWFTMAAVIFVFSLGGFPLAGIMFYVVSLMANIVFLTEIFSFLPLPIHFATLSSIAASNPQNELAELLKVGMVYLGIDLLLCAVTCVGSKRIQFFY